MKKKVYAYLHTHWDIEWYRDEEDFNIRLIDIMDGVIEELIKGNAPYFYLDGQVAALLNYLKFREEKKEIILKLIKEKKLGIGPFFVSADTYLSNFRCMLKNLEVGLNYSKKFNQKEFIGYICDVFGISNSIFEALKLKNIDKAVIWRGVNPDKIFNNCNFLKNDIKTHWLAQGYFNDFLNEKINLEGLKNYLDKISKFSPNNILLPIGADHLGMLKDANIKIKEINKNLKDYEIILTSPFEYFKNANFKNVTKEKEFLDNSNTYILGGVYSSRIPLKIKNSIIQNKITRIIEPLNYFLKDKYSTQIDYAYENLLKNLAHDGICGCSLDVVHKKNDYRFDKCLNILNSIQKNLIYNFNKENYSKNNSIGLFNLTNSNNLKTIEINLPYVLPEAQVLDYVEKFPDEYLCDIYKIPVTEEITKYYRQLIEISKNDKMSFNNIKIKNAVKNHKISKKSIENNFVKLEIKKENIIVSNKKNNISFLLKLTDIKDNGDSYNFSPSGKNNKLKLLKTEILYDDKIESCLRLYFKDIFLDILLNNTDEFLRFKFEINNKKKNHKLQLVLKLKNNISTTIAQDAVGTIERKCDYNYKMTDFIPAKRPYELKTNSYPMQNFVSTQGITCLTKGLNEYEIYKDELRICLLRSTGTISNPKNPSRAIPAGPNLKTPMGQNIGKINEECAILIQEKTNLKKIYQNLDIFYKNYLAFECKTDKDTIKFADLGENEIFLGVLENKKIVYNLKIKNISLV